MHHRPAPMLLFLSAACAVPAPPPADPDLVRAAGRTLAAIERAPHDPARHAATCKVFHHVFAPDGRLLTKGLGGEFPHHRGLFLGWNQLQWNGGRLDFWHCNRGETQQFRAFLPGTVLGLPADAQVAAIDWCTPDGTVIVGERRGLCGRELAAGIAALDLTVELRATAGPVRLDGDPQHAGQQFRALQAFAAKDGPAVRYVRPAAAVADQNDVWRNCAWIAAVLPFADGPVTVLRIEGPGNPQPCAWSTRPYGRFGATFTHDLAAEQVLRLQWTYVVAAGELDGPTCERLAAAARR